jgi:hypothetical protein
LDAALFHWEQQLLATGLIDPRFAATIAADEQYEKSD